MVEAASKAVSQASGCTGCQSTDGQELGLEGAPPAPAGFSGWEVPVSRQLSCSPPVLGGHVLPKDPLPAPPRLAGSASSGVQAWAQQHWVEDTDTSPPVSLLLASRGDSPHSWGQAVVLEKDRDRLLTHLHVGDLICFEVRLGQLCWLSWGWVGIQFGFPVEVLDTLLVILAQT